MTATLLLTVTESIRSAAEVVTLYMSSVTCQSQQVRLTTHKYSQTHNDITLPVTSVTLTMMTMTMTVSHRH